MPTKQPTINEVGLYDFCNALLSGAESVELAGVYEQYAEIIDLKLKGEKTHLFKIQWPDENSDYSRPALWLYNAWYNDSIRRVRLREKSEKERETRFILEENLKRLSKAIATYCNVDQDTAQSMALGALRNNRKGFLALIQRERGIKLIETIEELRGQ